MKMFKELFLANWREFARDRTALFFTIAFPILFIVLFGLIFRTPGKFDEKVGIALEDQGPVGQQIAAMLEALPAGQPGQSADDNPFSKLTFERGAQADLNARLLRGDIQALVVIPAGTSAAGAGGQTAAVQLQVDQSSQVFAPFMRGVLDEIVKRADPVASKVTPALRLEVKPVLADGLKAIDYLIPGILAMSIMQLGLFATAQPMIALRTQGVLKRLGATPLPRTTLLMAYIALRLLIAMIQTAIIVVIGTLLFDVSMVGNWLALFGWLMLSTLMFIAIGFFIAAVAKTEESGNAITNLVNFPMLFLSGVFFQVNGMPAYLQPIIKALPLTYTVDALKQTMIGAPPVNGQLVNLGVQLAWLAAMTLLAVRFFRWDAR
ncbi:MAG TPA: ABC transporter permease [Herpetosiphonaceae bacterium]|nr:ABC transporter permease [Herpetosiphonaceae bacterium]